MTRFTGKKYTYKDFITGKIHFTKGQFLGWQKGGVLNVQLAIFATKRTYLAIPAYLLTPETKAQIDGEEVEK